MAKKLSIEAEMRAAQRDMKKKLNGEDKEEVKKVKKKAKPVKEQYKEIKESLKEKEAPKEIAFKDNYEEELIRELFKGDITVSQALGKEDEPEQPKREKSGLWDYVLEDEIEFFDPECSYELTGYRPIDETHGLDFDPAPFCEAGRVYTETGHYTEYPSGSKPYADFWQEQLDRCINGYTIGKYRITGDNYFFLNFYRMPVVDDSKKLAEASGEGFPKFVAEQYKFFHYFEMCELLKKDCVALKSRGIGWSEIGACLGVRPFITGRNFNSTYITSSLNYLEPTLNKCWAQLHFLNGNTNGGFRRPMMKINNALHKRTSLTNNENREWGRLNNIEGIVADNINKVRGIRSNRLFWEEGGSFKNLETAWIKGEALVTVAGARKGIMSVWGTGGDSDASALEGLSKMFNNPKEYNVLPYKNNYSEDGEVQYTGYFIPAFNIMLKKGFYDNRGVTDRKKAREHYETERKKKSGQNLLDYCAEFCFTPSEALLKQGDGIFDPVLIADRLTQLRIQKVGVKPQQVDLLWDVPKGSENNPRNKVKLIPNPQGKVFIYEPPLRDGEGNLYKNLYVAGIDSIDQGTADSSTNNDVSDFCIVIKKRTLGSSSPNYVAIYKDRPRDIATAYENAMKLCIYYNCKAMLEHTKISIIMYFRSKKKDNLFMKRPKSTMPDIRKGNSGMIGYPATETYLRHGLELISRFVDESCYSMQIDEMLEQLLKYSWEHKRKFDIVAAMVAAELGDEDLLGFTPKAQDEVRNSWKDFGWYYDLNGQKRYGIIPS